MVMFKKQGIVAKRFESYLMNLTDTIGEQEGIKLLQ